MRLICLTVSHATANVALREKLAIPPRDLDAALAELKTSFPAAEFMILSTCNRTEIYVARATHGHPRIETLLTWWAGRSDVPLEALEAVVDTYTDSDAIGHVFSVAAGLESLVPGEVQILGQLKDAYQGARQAGSTGTLINTLIQSALRAGKEVRHVTGIDQGKVSVASVAIDCVLDHAADLADLNVLSIGAGEMSRLMPQGIVGRQSLRRQSHSPGQPTRRPGREYRHARRLPRPGRYRAHVHSRCGGDPYPHPAGNDDGES
jgi:glutamyl-tRNA reductase